MIKAVNIKGYWPEVVSKIYAFQAIAEAEDAAFSEAWAASQAVKDDQFIESATRRGIERWERRLGIAPKANEALEDRKFRLFSRFNEQLPYTEQALKERLTTLCGDGFMVSLDTASATLTVRIELTVKEQFEVVAQLLEDIVPLNVGIDLSLRYNSHAVIKRQTHAQLAARQHTQIREEKVEWQDTRQTTI